MSRVTRFRQFGQQLFALASEARRLLAFGVVLVLSAWLFLGILEDVVTGDPLVQVDAAVFHSLQTLRNNWLDSLMVAATEFGDTIVVSAVAIVVFLYFALRRDLRTGLYWAIAVAGASFLNSVVKVALHRARPTELLYTGWSAYSFPSGHSTVNLVTYCFLALIVGRNSGTIGRAVLVLLAGFFISVIAFSRLYLGAHWFSDVMGGMAFGTAWFAILGYFYLRKRVERTNGSTLLFIVAATLLVVGVGNIYLHHSSDVVLYSVKTRAGS